MATRQYKKIADKIYKLGNTVYFRAQLNHQRIMVKAPLQGALAIDNRGRATPQLKQALYGWISARYNITTAEKSQKLVVPSIKQLVELYEKYAEQQRIKTGKPSQVHVRNVMIEIRALVEHGGWKWSDSVESFTVDRLDQFLVNMVKAGKSRVTAWTYVTSIKCLAAAWTKTYYARDGFEVPQFQLPVFANVRAKRYERPSKESLAQVKEWYQGLWERDRKMWLAATMMLQFATRNGDVMRMEPTWFKCVEDHVEFVYQPHKTGLSSGRWCRSIVHPEIYSRIKTVFAELEEQERVESDRPEPLQVEDCDDGEGILGRNCSPRMFFHYLNKDLEDHVPEFKSRNKSSYELRKICTDHVYQRFGAEAASAISGDDIKTVSYFYAQPDRAAPTAIRIDQMI